MSTKAVDDALAYAELYGFHVYPAETLTDAGVCNCYKGADVREPRQAPPQRPGPDTERRERRDDGRGDDPRMVEDVGRLLRSA